MQYVALMFILALMVFVGSDWYSAAVAIKISLLAALIICGLVVIGRIGVLKK